MNKSALKDAIIGKLQLDLEQQTAAAHLARDEAISEESRPENQYDMHSQEAAYLAEGQAKLAAQIAEQIAQFTGLALPTFDAGSAIAVGALVALSSEKGVVTRYFIGPRAGGVEVGLDGDTVLVITPQSPLGHQLVGKRVGDTVQLPGRQAQRILTVE